MKADIKIFLTFTKPSFRGLITRKHSKIAHPYITYNMQNRYLHNAFDAKIVWNSIWLYKSSYQVHFTAGNIDMLSAKGFFFTFKKENVFL